MCFWKDPINLGGVQAHAVGQLGHGNLAADISPDVIHGLLKARELAALGTEEAFLLFFLRQPRHEKIKLPRDVEHIFSSLAFFIDVLDAVLQKRVLIIMKDQVLPIQTGFLQNLLCFPPEKSDPAEIPGFLFVRRVNNGLTRQDRKPSPSLRLYFAVSVW